MKRFTYPLLGVAIGTVVSLLWWRRESRQRSLRSRQWLGWMLENPLANSLAGPDTLLPRIGVRPGDRCLDVGAGTGRLAIPAARLVGEYGLVVALDIQPALLARLQEQAAEAGVDNMEICLGDISGGAGLNPSTFDRAWMVTVLGEVPNRRATMAHIYRLLKPRGVLSVTEIFPDPHFQRRSTVIQLARLAGFVATRYWGTNIAYTQNFVKPMKVA